jgi:hypothetical protein
MISRPAATPSRAGSRPPGSPRRVFRAQGRDRLLCVLGRGGTAIDEPAWRFVDRRRLELCSAPPRYPAFGPRPISNQMHLPVPGRPFGSKD